MTVGPVVLQVVGDRYVSSGRIAAVLWEGATTAGDRVEIRDLATNALLMSLRTPDTHTLLGVTFPKARSAPNGFILTTHTPGANARVLVYLEEI